MSLGEKIRYYRQIKGLTQEELANRIGVSPQSIHRWEKEARSPTAKYLNKIAQTLEVSPITLLEDPLPTFSKTQKPTTLAVCKLFLSLIQKQLKDIEDTFSKLINLLDQKEAKNGSERN